MNALLKAIRGALASGETVSLAGFGTLSTRSRTARQRRNPAMGERILIAAPKTPSFKAGKTPQNRDACGFCQGPHLLP